MSQQLLNAASYQFPVGGMKYLQEPFRHFKTFSQDFSAFFAQIAGFQIILFVPHLFQKTAAEQDGAEFFLSVLFPAD
jgi:hypothetical protein